MTNETNKTTPASQSATRIALLADIHGNLPALEAVLADARAVAAHYIWNLGDLLGYTPMPNEVIDLLRQHQAVNILGNYDIKVLKYPVKRDKWQRKKSSEKLAAFAFNDVRLSEGSRLFLMGLPEDIEMSCQGWNFLLTHGSPASRNEHLTSDTPEERLAELLETTETDAVLCGHSHDPFARRIGKQWVINPGSVGRPERGDNRACYALLTVTSEGVQIEHRRLDYDIERAVQAIREEGLPLRYGEVLRRGHNLDALDHDPQMHADLVAASQALAQQLDPEPEHAAQVVKLAGQLFDQLSGLTPKTEEDRVLLTCAAWLHDIGWSQGRKRHHKTALDLILADTEIPFSPRQRTLVALIARYHRRALPQLHHRIYRDLDEIEQERVQQLASLLRMADGMDRGHVGAVQQITCSVGDEVVEIQCHGAADTACERHTAQEKADLFIATFGRDVQVR